MTEQEFSVLDELYFLVSFEELSQSTDLPSEELLSVLAALHHQGYLRCYARPEEELEAGQTNIRNQGKNYYYLASKAGLLAHNSR